MWKAGYLAEYVWLWAVDSSSGGSYYQVEGHCDMKVDSSARYSYTIVIEKRCKSSLLASGAKPMYDTAAIRIGRGDDGSVAGVC